MDVVVNGRLHGSSSVLANKQGTDQKEKKRKRKRKLAYSEMRSRNMATPFLEFLIKGSFSSSGAVGLCTDNQREEGREKQNKKLPQRDRLGGQT